MQIILYILLIRIIMHVPLEEMLAYLLMNRKVKKQSCDLLSWFIVLHSQPCANHSVRHFL